MTKYNNDYAFIVKNDDDDGYPFLKTDTNTADRFYQTEPLAMGSAPLIFSNGHRALFASRSIKEKRADVLFDGVTFIVKNRIRTALLALELPTINMHPAVYIDDTGAWHQDYWYVAVQQVIACVDRSKSRFMPPRKPDADLSVSKYSLNEKVLDAIPLRERLFFGMGATTDGMVVCHRSLFKHFKDGGVQIEMIGDF